MINHKNQSPTMLLILDGFGYRKDEKGNAVANANMPYWDNLLKTYPNVLLNASGTAVGLVPGYMGNSEVGHTCMGSGRIIKTSLVKFNEAIKNNSFFKSETLIKHFTELKSNNKSLHLMGLLSDAGVHSHKFHLYAIIKLAQQIGIKNVFIHAFLDGRDTPAKSAPTHLSKLDGFCKTLNYGKIATIHGRFYAMDRDQNWNRTQKTYNTLTSKQIAEQQTWQTVLKSFYNKNITDEFIEPTQLIPNATIKNNDGIFFFNYRPDRARQLTESFINPDFNHFPVKNLNSTNNTLAFFISTTRYKDEFAKFNKHFIIFGITTSLTL